MVTIKDIAREAGVSHGTVSNVFNKTNKVSIKKIRAVEEAARKLGYIPNYEAKKLRKGSLEVVSLILPSLEIDKYRDFHETLRTDLESAGFSIDLSITHDIENIEESVLEKIAQSSLAAIVSVTCLSSRAEKLYSQFACPVFFVDRQVEKREGEYGFAGFDLEKTGKDISEHILSKGYKEVAFFSSPSKFCDDAILFSLLKKALDGRVRFIRYSSDINLSVVKAFAIIKDMPGVDLVVATSSVRADAFQTVLNISGFCKKPEIIALSSSYKFPHPHYKTYQLDYSLIAKCISKAIIKGKISKTIEMPKGFPFSFAGIKNIGPKKLTLLTLPSPSIDALSALLPMLRDVTGIELSIFSAPYDEVIKHVRMQSPLFHHDLIRFDIAMVDEMKREHLRPLNNLGISKIISSELVEYGHSDLSNYAIPFEPSSLIMLYRTDLFSDTLLGRMYYEKYRKKLEVPKTLEDYARVSEFFTRSINPESPMLYGTTAASGHTTTLSNNFLVFALSNNAIGEEKGKIIIDKERLSESIEFFLRIVKCSNPVSPSWWEACVQDFALGQAATVITYSNHINYLMNSKHSNVVGRVGATVIPGGATLLGGGMLGISKYSECIDECLRFIEWYYSDDISSAVTMLGGTSPLKAVYDDPSNQMTFPWLNVAKESLSIGVRGFKRYDKLSIGEFETIVGSAIQQAIIGRLSAEETASMIEEQINWIESRHV